MEFIKNKPYTYLIGWSNLNKYYYGVRYSKKCCYTDLFVKYFTSSKIVKKFILTNGLPDIIKVRRVFNDRNSALNWEHRVLKKLNVFENTKYLNCSVGSNGISQNKYNSYIKTIQINQKIRIDNKTHNFITNHPMNKLENRNKISKSNLKRAENNKLNFQNNNPMKDKNFAKYHNNKIGKMLKGRSSKKLTSETKQKISDAIKKQSNKISKRMKENNPMKNLDVIQKSINNKMKTSVNIIKNIILSEGFDIEQWDGVIYDLYKSKKVKRIYSYKTYIKWNK